MEIAWLLLCLEHVEKNPASRQIRPFYFLARQVGVFFAWVDV
jgi:hypothetical protein